jgi:hypothetical protein
LNPPDPVNAVMVARISEPLRRGIGAYTAMLGATSVTPFASRAQDKALHAVLVALVRHTVPGMDDRPRLDDIRRAGVERIAGLIESRAARVDRPSEPTFPKS